ncbi:unnamed protein product [Rotaria socialis]|uniref:Polyketide synthase n=1 Tax=Rotaria socialis TaxID=392032 RepID=A0A818P851_9BILA|nr:unnamed protein product [Rotaria socialis]CAF4638258.1 unnamed protein product [Rotaria socialis]
MGDGLGLLLLKRLSDAERDGDRIYCVIRDVLSNHDGNEDKSSFVVPSAAGQTRLLNSVYQRAKLDPQRIFYVEAHGTGTPVGDPIEANCLGKFFHRSRVEPPLLIGSVKSNLGHTEGAAGVAGLIKVVLSMHHRTIPPNMQFKALNPKIEAQRYNLHVVQHLTPLPQYVENEPICMGVNSFGMGGNNTHAIIEEYRPTKSIVTNGATNGDAEIAQEKNNQYFIFIFSSKNRESLNGQVAEFNLWLKKTSTLSIEDDHAFLQRLSRQLLLKRTISHTHIATFVFSGRKRLLEQLASFLIQETTSGLSIELRPTVPTSKLYFVFSGQGPQWWAMGRQLYESEPLFSQWVQRIDSELTKVNNGEWRLLEELIEKKNENESRINDTNIAQPALFAIQVALTALLTSWNIYPSSIISHSAGDQAAAFVAGRLTLEEAVRIVYHRSRLQNRNTRQGGRMLAVSMSEDEVKNPRSVTLSGDEKTIDEIQKILSALYPNVFKARLRIENAFHSYQMERFDIEKEMLSSLKDIRGLPLKDKHKMFNPKCSEASLYSSVTGKRLDDELPVDAHYWWSNVRHAVRFNDAIASIADDEAATAFIEISPHPVLATSIRECYEGKNWQPLILSTLKRKEDEQISLLTNIAQLTASSDVWQKYFKTRNTQSMKEDDQLFDDFPLYKFHLNSCWYESKDSVIKRLAHRIPSHPLLGVRQLTGQTNATWKCLININLPQYAYFKDHKIQDALLFPAVGFLELAAAACRQLLPSTDDKQPIIVFEQIKFVKGLALTEHELTEVFTQIIMPMREWFIYSRPWTGAGQECMRSSGMASTDVVDSFVDPETLNQYSLREFTLHAHGRIDMENTSQKFMTIFTDNAAPDTWSTHDLASVYTHLAARGYQYGPAFRRVQSLRGTTSTVVAELDSDLSSISDLSSYQLFHPTLLDSSFHPLLALLPGFDSTFIPISIQKFVSTGKVNTNVLKLEMRGKYLDNVCGLAQARTYTTDLVILPTDASLDQTMFMFEGLTIRQIQGTQSGESAQVKSVFDKLNAAADVPNADHTEQLDAIMKDYCMRRRWVDTLIVTNLADLFPSGEKIFNAGFDVLSNQELVKSIEPFNQLAACYAQIALKDLDLSLVDQNYHSLLSSCQSLASTQSEQASFHSTQLRLMTLFDRFPQLKPILTALNTYGSHLKQVLNGQQNALELFLGDDQTEQNLQQIQTIISMGRIEMIFQAIKQYLQQHDQNNNGSLSNRRLRIFWLVGGDCCSFLPILELLLNLSSQTGLRVDIHYADTDSRQITRAEQTFETHLDGQNSICITYDQTFDLFNNEDRDKIPIESFDIMLTANKLQGCKDLKQSIIDLRRLLVPNGLLLLLELIGVPHYFDLIFGLLDQWWSPSGRGRAFNDIDQWTTALKEASGFESIKTFLSSYESTLIMAQKTKSSELLQRLDERKTQAWLLFAKDNQKSLAHSIASLLPCSNFEYIDMYDSDMEKIRSVVQKMMAQYGQLYIVFAWPLEQTALEENSDLAFKQHEESMCGTLAQVLQLIQAISPKFCPFVFVITRDAQLNIESGCNII